MPTGIHLSKDDIAKIRKLYAEGLHTSAIASRMGIHQNTVMVHCSDLRDNELRYEYAAAPHGRKGI